MTCCFKGVGPDALHRMCAQNCNLLTPIGIVDGSSKSHLRIVRFCSLKADRLDDFHFSGRPEASAIAT